MKYHDVCVGKHSVEHKLVEGIEKGANNFCEESGWIVKDRLE